MFWTIFPFILSSLLLGAHFLRSSAFGLMWMAILMPFLLLIKKRWVLITAQIYLYLGAALWLLYTYNKIQERIFFGDDWVRLAIILGIVAAFTVFSGLLLNRKTIKEKYSETAAVSES